MINNISHFLLRFCLTRPGRAWQYSLIMWAETYTVGCGFTGRTISNGYYYRNYVCLYGPGGNIVGDNSSMYLIGPACSACPAGTTCDDGLCA